MKLLCTGWEKPWSWPIYRYTTTRIMKEKMAYFRRFGVKELRRSENILHEKSDASVVACVQNGKPVPWHVAQYGACVYTATCVGRSWRSNRVEQAKAEWTTLSGVRPTGTESCGQDHREGGTKTRTSDTYPPRIIFWFIQASASLEEELTFTWK